MKKTNAVLAVAIATSVSGCGSRGAPDALGATLHISTFCSEHRRIALQENADVVTVTPLMTVLTNDNIVIADAKEAQVRTYDPDGRLLSHMGRPGRGPGEFFNPRSIAGAVGHPDYVLVADLSGTLSWMDTDGDSAVAVQQTPISPMYGAIQLNDSTVLIAGQSIVQPTPYLLHLWDIKHRNLRKDFFPVPSVNPRLEYPTLAFGWASFDTLGDRIAAVFSISDTLYVFSFAGNLKRRIPLRLEHYRPVHSRPPRTAGRTEALERWLESFSQLTSVTILQDSTVLIQYTDRKSGLQQWRLANISLSGALRFDALHSPKLMSRSADRKRLYFLDPSSATPNWLIECSM